MQQAALGTPHQCQRRVCVGGAKQPGGVRVARRSTTSSAVRATAGAAQQQKPSAAPAQTAAKMSDGRVSWGGRVGACTGLLGAQAVPLRAATPSRQAAVISGLPLPP
jgi:hypothetical protein